MKIRCKLYIAVLAAAFLVISTGCSSPPQSLDEIVARSVAAHGGDALTNWQTMSVAGIVHMSDAGVWFDAAYSLLADKSGKLRVEHDMTADRGRIFNVYYFNNGVGWMQRNLIPSARPQYNRQFKRWLDQCDGIAWFVGNASLTQKDDGEIDGKDAYVLEAVADSDTTMLYIDKKNFYLVQEKYGNITRTHTDFRKFAGSTRASKVHQVTKTARGSSEMTFTIESIEFNVPIEPEVFTEDMPKTAQR